MKRHLLVLAPLAIFALFVGCEKGDDTPPPALLSETKKTEIVCNFDMAIGNCKKGMNDILPLILAGQNSGNGNGGNIALISAMLQKKEPAAQRPPPPANCTVFTGNQHNEVSCNDGLVQAVLLAKTTSTDAGPKFWENERYRSFFEAKLRNAAVQFGQSSGLNPLQQTQLGFQFDQAMRNTGTFTESDLRTATAAIQSQGGASTAYNGVGGMTLGNSNNTATLNSALNNNSATLGTNTGNGGTGNTAYSQARVPASTSLNLGVREAQTQSRAAQQTLDANAMRAAIGYGLPSSAASAH